MALLPCERYAVFTLVVTAIWVYIARNRSFRTLAIAMYFPAVFYLLFTRQTWTEVAVAVLGLNQGAWIPIYYSVISCLLVMAIIAGCVLVSVSLGWGKNEPSANSDLQIEMAGDIGMGLLRAAGEEIGWRVYLLPCLLENYPPIKALLICGIVWGLYHVPVMILLTHKLKARRPWTTVTVQFTSCLVCTFIFSWIAIKTGFSFWAPTLMHFTFNRINPPTLGSIYTQGRGKIKGVPWLINAEGVAGIIVMLPLAYYLQAYM